MKQRTQETKQLQARTAEARAVDESLTTKARLWLNSVRACFLLTGLILFEAMSLAATSSDRSVLIVFAVGFALLALGTYAMVLAACRARQQSESRLRVFHEVAYSLLTLHGGGFFSLLFIPHAWTAVMTDTDHEHLPLYLAMSGLSIIFIVSGAVAYGKRLRANEGSAAPLT